jgi:hypothetical protein
VASIEQQRELHALRTNVEALVEQINGRFDAFLAEAFLKLETALARIGELQPAHVDHVAEIRSRLKIRLK